MESSVQETALVWLCYASVGLLLLLISAAIVLYFQPKNAATSSIPAFAGTSTLSAAPLQVSSKLVNGVCIVTLYLSLLCLFTAPVDVYLLENALPHVRTNGSVLKTLYAVYFGTLVAYSFVGAPLLYFYAKQTEIAHLTMLFSARKRFVVALKRTMCFLLALFLLVLMIMTLLLCGKPASSDIDWLKPLLNMSSDLTMLLRLLMGILVLFGMYLWIVVCSRGLASVPLVGLLMDDHSMDEQKSTFQDLLNENAMEAQATFQTRETILKRYAEAHSMSIADRERLEQLKLREKLLEDRRGVLDANLKQFALGSRWSCWRIPIGLFFLLMSLLILSSMLITSVDKLLHSSFHHGFLLNAPVLPNPVDALLVLASHFFPLDYVLFGVLFVYLFVVSFVVLLRHGLRLACLRMDRVRPRLTSSSTMTLVSLVMIYMAMVALFSVLTLAPQYATFGHQVYADPDSGVVKPCTLDQAMLHLEQHCRMTQLAQFYNALAVGVPLFGAAFFVCQLVFIGAFVPWLAYSYAAARELPEVDPKRERLLDDYEA